MNICFRRQLAGLSVWVWGAAALWAPLPSMAATAGGAQSVNAQRLTQAGSDPANWSKAKQAGIQKFRSA